MPASKGASDMTASDQHDPDGVRAADANLAADMRSLFPKFEPSRRDAMLATLATGFALATQPVAAETTITTDTDGLDAGEVQVAAPDRAIPAYRAKPAEGGPFPVVLVVQEIFGVHEHIKDVCRRLAKAGYLAIAPEMYVRQGDVAGLKSIDEVRAVVAKVPDAQVMSDLDAAVAFAASDGGDVARLGITGFCWGRAHHLALCRAQPGAQGGCRMVRASRRGGLAAHAETSNRHCRRPRGARARSLRRCRPGHPARHRGCHAGGVRESR
jgi:hypothetical protein